MAEKKFFGIPIPHLDVHQVEESVKKWLKNIPIAGWKEEDTAKYKEGFNKTLGKIKGKAEELKEKAESIKAKAQNKESAKEESPKENSTTTNKNK